MDKKSRFVCHVCLFFLLFHASQMPAVHADDSCGHQKPVMVRQNRIVNGEAAVYDQFPWIVSLQYYNPNRQQYLHYCGGSIVAPNIIVTAAHCSPFIFSRNNKLDFREVKILAGCLKWNTADQDEHCQSIIVHGSDFIDYPDYSAGTPVNDIAIARMRQSFQMTDSVTTVCMPTPEELYKGMATIAGWGKHSYEQTTSELYFETDGVMRTADVNILPSEACRAYSMFRSELNICAGFPSGARDSCAGDSGGPLMAKVNDQVFMIGIVSHGNECGRAGFPGVYVRVAAKRRWIDSNMR